MPLLSKTLNQSAGTHSHFRAEELLLLKFFDQVPYPMAMLLGNELVFAYANLAFREFVNRDLLGKRIRDVFPDEDSLPYLRMLEKVFQSGEPQIGKESPVILHDIGDSTHEHFINFGFHPFRDDEGVTQGIIIQFQEVTDQVLPKRALLETQRALELALRSARMESWRIDVKTRIVIGSRIMGKGSSQRATEGPFEEIVRQVVHAEDCENVIAALTSAMDSHTPYEQQFRVVTPQGEIRWIHSQGTLDYDAEGNLTTLAGVSTDITERRQAEIDLAFEKQKLETVFRKSPAAMAIWRGEELIFEKVNPGYQALFGKRPLVGLAFTEAVPEFEGQGFDDLIRNVLRTGEPFVGQEVLARHQVDEVGPVQDRYYDFTYLRIMGADGKPYGVYDHAVDVTERVIARRALESSVENLKNERDLREQFVTTLSHDLRNPLTAAKMSAQLIQRNSKDDPATQKHIQRIVQNLDRADHMIRDLLDANRIKAGGGLPIHIQECDLSEALTSTLRELNQLHGERFRSSGISPGTRCFVDSSSVVRIIENLAGNAVKYGSANGPITVSMRFENDELTLSVHNEGNPIPVENQATLFEHYQRTGCAESSGQKGWGIGLTLVRGIAESHRGKAWVESSENLGTTFYVRMPKDARAASTASPLLN